MNSSVLLINGSNGCHDPFQIIGLKDKDFELSIDYRGGCWLDEDYKSTDDSVNVCIADTGAIGEILRKKEDCVYFNSPKAPVGKVGMSWKIVGFYLPPYDMMGKWNEKGGEFGDKKIRISGGFYRLR